MKDKASAKRVLVICTGGTIGMRPGPRGLVPGDDFAHRARTALMTLPTGRQSALPELDFLEYEDPMDSSSARPAHWYRIARDIRHYGAEHVGIVVIHGTDTLAWSAASLAWQLSDLPVPIIVTGAQRPLEVDGSDGLANLEQALAFAALDHLTGVHVAFGGVLLHGHRARKWDTHEDLAFASPNSAPSGYWQQYTPVAELSGKPQQPHLIAQALTRAAASLHEEGTKALGPDHLRVVRLPLWPGMGADQVESLLQTADGVVLEAWGSGNLPEDVALQKVLSDAVTKGTAIVVISQCPHGATSLQSYATGQALSALGVMDGGDMTPEAAFTLLHFLLLRGLEGDALRALFEVV